MSGNRYQLIRREAISLGLSGLEIDVFDFHSNKSRHISSLSGGETFQASLALALFFFHNCISYLNKDK